MNHQRFLLISTLALCLLGSGCTDESETPEDLASPPETVRFPADEEAGDSGTPGADDAADASSGGDPAPGAAPSGGTAGGAADAGTSGQPATGAPSRAGAETGADAEAGENGRWSMGTLTSTFEGTVARTDVDKEVAGAPVLQAVRTGRHEQFDRVVFEFGGDAVPGYEVEYVEQPIYHCASGALRHVRGMATLRIDLRPAQAHTEAGAPTVRNIERERGFVALREAEQICDFEGVVTWTLGLSDRVPYRVQEFRNPARLVVDVRHSAE